MLLLVYGAGSVLGNHLGGRLADKVLMPSLARLLTALAGTLTLFWAVAEIQLLAVALVFVLGALAFAIIPGMQTGVVGAAGAAPTLAVAVNASGFQLAAAFAGRIGGWAPSMTDPDCVRSIRSPLSSRYRVCCSRCTCCGTIANRCGNPADRYVVESGCCTICLESRGYYLARALYGVADIRRGVRL
ncbi:hypothetical protein ACQP0C_09970 [Nocardia sp. CA-129566]|uniref:hypothetical protein n=1 Tax=Nocardia sp. CA-129566 TaxID=3239976 RepID=UPI003D971228